MFEESLGLLQAFQCLFTVYPFQQNIVFSFSREEWFAEYFWGPTSRGCPALYEDRPHERLVASKLRQDSLPGEPSMADCSFSMSLVKVIKPQRITKAYPQIDSKKCGYKTTKYTKVEHSMPAIQGSHREPGNQNPGASLNSPTMD